MSDDSESFDEGEAEEIQRPKRNAGHFPAGRSGNPKGRPRKVMDHRSVAEQAFLEPVEVTMNGKKTSVPFVAALFMSLKQQALKGSVKAAEILLKQCPLSVLEEIDEAASERQEREEKFMDALFSNMSPSALREFRAANLEANRLFPKPQTRSRKRK